MSNYICTSPNCFIPVSGAFQFFNEGDTAEGDIDEVCLKHFRVANEDEQHLFTKVAKPVEVSAPVVVELTNAQLKAILDDRGVDYPTVVNKAQLKELVAGSTEV